MDFMFPKGGYKKGDLAVIISKPRPAGVSGDFVVVETDFTKLEELVLSRMTQEEHERARRELGFPIEGIEP